MQGLENGVFDEKIIESMHCQSKSVIDGLMAQANDDGQQQDGVWNHKGVETRS